jgi:hypothetical protein
MYQIINLIENKDKLDFCNIRLEHHKKQIVLIEELMTKLKKEVVA